MSLPGAELTRPRQKLVWRTFLTSRVTTGLLFLALSSLFTSCSSPHVSTSDEPPAPSALKQDLVSPSAVSHEPNAAFSEAHFEFGEVLAGDVVEHDFAVTNRGAAPISIKKVQMTTPLLVTQMPRQVAPGREGRIHFHLDTANLQGKFEGTILVFLDDPALPEAHLAFAGHVVPPIELSPRPAFFVAGLRGHGNRGSIEIVNHESEPLTIEKVEHPAGRFKTELETLEHGQRYRFTLDLNPDGPGGRTSDSILIRTSSKRMPTLQVSANTYLYERVHAFPEVVDFGTWHAGDAVHATTTIMIHQEGGADFRVQLSTDVPGLTLKSERAQKGDQYQVEATLAPQKIQVGQIKGSIFIDTNDPQFPRLTVPVNGQILER